ncbi:hypothetical protein V6N13_071989 [Hibiscus sabdariffa]
MCHSTPQEREQMSQVPYASAIGSIMYDMICTRTDLSYALSMTSRYQANLGEGHWTTVKNILKYLRRTKDVFLVYGGEKELGIKGYTDASFQTDKDDSRTKLGFVFCLNGGAVSWKSSKQDTVADSTTEAEYIAASETAKEAVWIKKFISELGVVPSISDVVGLYCDNNGAITQAKEPRSHQRSKHILICFHLIREIVDRGDVEICKVHTDDNIADPLMKPLAQQKYDRHTKSLSIRYLSPPNPNPTLGFAPTPYPGIGVCDFFILPERSFRDFCSLVYSGGLNRDLDEIFVEIQDSSASFHQEIKVVISPVNLVSMIFWGNRKVKVIVPKFDDLIVKHYGSRSL